MTNGLPERTAEWLSSALGPTARIHEIAVLSDTSHTNHRLRVQAPGGAEVELLLRGYTDGELLASDPWYSPADEVAALRALESTDLPVPRVVAADVGGDMCDVPTLLLTWLPGHPPDTSDDLDAFVHHLAEPLPTIHAVDAPNSMRIYESYVVSDGIDVRDLQPPAWAFDVRTWERAFELVAQDPPPVRERFIHRDYHHGNTVWREGRLTGIVDWTTGCVGSPMIDVAHARMNLAWDFDLETADAFLEAGRGLEPDLDIDPYWEVLDAVDGLLSERWSDADPETLRRYETYVTRVLADLD